MMKSLGFCKECKFWKRRVDSVTNKLLGECHRYAPMPMARGQLNPSSLETRWALTEPEDGCGEFEFEAVPNLSSV